MAQPQSKDQYSWRAIAAAAIGLGAFGLVYGWLQIGKEAGLWIGLLIAVAAMIFGIIMRTVRHSRTSS